MPTSVKREFLKTYETLSPMVVPRSAMELDHDDEFTLFAAATFKKHSADFIHKCREQKWTPRQYTYVEGGREEEQRELDRVTNEERKVCGEALRMGRTGWSESVMVWIHVLTLRVFVEAVLRYGLPLEYVTALIKVCAGAVAPFASSPSFLGLFIHAPLIAPRALADMLRHADDAEAGPQGQGRAGLELLVPRRQRLWSGQARPRHQGRRRHELGDGGRRAGDGRGARVHGLRLLRVGVSLTRRRRRRGERTSPCACVHRTPVFYYLSPRRSSPSPTTPAGRRRADSSSSFLSKPL